MLKLLELCCEGALATTKYTPTAIMLPALPFLALASAALAIPFPFKLPSWNTQAPFVPSKFQVDPPKVEIGWADPRILGGKFIDVSFPSPLTSPRL